MTKGRITSLPSHTHLITLLASCLFYLPCDFSLIIDMIPQTAKATMGLGLIWLDKNLSSKEIVEV